MRCAPASDTAPHRYSEDSRFTSLLTMPVRSASTSSLSRRGQRAPRVSRGRVLPVGAGGGNRVGATLSQGRSVYTLWPCASVQRFKRGDCAWTMLDTEHNDSSNSRRKTGSSAQGSADRGGMACFQPCSSFNTDVVGLARFKV
jgi:hypothetical protein